MKICPDCALANEERFPTCIVCNVSLADVPSTPSADPAHPEHARRAREQERRWITRRQLGWAAVCDVAIVTGLAFYPGLMFDPEVLTLYAASAAIVAMAVWQEMAGVFLAGFLQGVASVTLWLCFGTPQPFALYMLAGHVLATMTFCHWVEMIHEANR